MSGIIASSQSFNSINLNDIPVGSFYVGLDSDNSGKLTIMDKGGNKSSLPILTGTVAYQSTTLTINGLSYDLSTNRSWTVSTGITYSGSTNSLAYFDTANGLSYSNFKISNNGLADTSSIVSLDINNRLLLDSSGTTSINYNSRLLNRSSNVITLDWESCVIYDTSGSIAMLWDSRQLVDGSGLTALRWQTRTMRAEDNSLAIIWDSTRTLYDATERPSINWSTRQMTDSSTISSLNYGSRILTNTSGNNVLDWNSDILITASNSAMYAADYSANYTNRSLVDKGYVDALNDNTAISVTQSGLNTRIANNTIIPQQWYSITDAQDITSGDILLIKGLTAGGVDTNGVWIHKTRILPVGKFCLTSGTSGTVSAVTVGGSNLLTSSIPYNTTRYQTALDISSNINAGTGTHNWIAYTIQGASVSDIPTIVLEYQTATASTFTLTVTSTGVSVLTTNNRLISPFGGQAPINITLVSKWDRTADRIVYAFDQINLSEVSCSTAKISLLGFNPVTRFMWGDPRVKNTKLIDTNFTNVWLTNSATASYCNNTIINSSLSNILLHKFNDNRLVTATVSNVSSVGPFALNGNNISIGMNISNITGGGPAAGTTMNRIEGNVFHQTGVSLPGISMTNCYTNSITPFAILNNSGAGTLTMATVSNAAGLSVTGNILDAATTISGITVSAALSFSGNKLSSASTISNVSGTSLTITNNSCISNFIFTPTSHSGSVTITHNIMELFQMQSFTGSNTLLSLCYPVSLQMLSMNVNLNARRSMMKAVAWSGSIDATITDSQVGPGNTIALGSNGLTASLTLLNSTLESSTLLIPDDGFYNSSYSKVNGLLMTATCSTKLTVIYSNITILELSTSTATQSNILLSDSNINTSVFTWSNTFSAGGYSCNYFDCSYSNLLWTNSAMTECSVNKVVMKNTDFTFVSTGITTIANSEFISDNIVITEVGSLNIDRSILSEVKFIDDLLPINSINYYYSNFNELNWGYFGGFTYSFKYCNFNNLFNNSILNNEYAISSGFDGNNLSYDSGKVTVRHRIVFDGATNGVVNTTSLITSLPPGFIKTNLYLSTVNDGGISLGTAGNGQISVGFNTYDEWVNQIGATALNDNIITTYGTASTAYTSFVTDQKLGVRVTNGNINSGVLTILLEGMASTSN